MLSTTVYNGTNFKFSAYTDGSYKPSLNQGGYASIILENDQIIAKLYQGFSNTTNNRCELKGVVETLKYFKTPVEICIYSDSQYVISSINNGHVFKWLEEKDYSKKNLDLWFELVDLLDFHNVTFKWIKGHNENKYNELADLYAIHAAECINPLIDLKYE